MTKKPGDRMHPNSLKNLAPPFKGDPDRARELQKLGVAKRKANKEARMKLQLAAAELKMDVDAVMEENEVSAIGVLKLAMVKAIDQNDFDTAADLAKSLAEFERPKLARVESKIEEVKTEDLTDEELDAKLKQLRVIK